MLKLNVILNDKREFMLYIYRDSTVEELREKISSKIDVDIDNLEIVFKGEALKDYQNISCKGIANNSIIRGVIRKNSKKGIIALSRAKSCGLSKNKLKEQMKDTNLNRIENRIDIMGKRKRFVQSSELFITKEDRKEKETVIPKQSRSISTDPLPVPFKKEEGKILIRGNIDRKK